MTQEAQPTNSVGAPTEQPTPQGNVQVQTPTAQPTAQPQSEVVYQPVPDFTGTSVLETSINIFASSAGIDAARFESAIENAVKYNDANLINIDALTAGLKPEQVAQAKALATAAFTETQSAIQRASQESIATAERLAGGAEQWKQISSTFNTRAPKHLKAVVSQMLDTGDVQNAVQFVIDTAKGVGLVSTGNEPMQGGVGGQAAATSGISQAEYFTKLSSLEREAGNRSFQQGEYAHKLQLLMQERKLGRTNGL